MKRAIVIGASSGIGREVARLLIGEGWEVGVAARREAMLSDLGAAATACIDVTADDATQRLQQLIADLGGMDLFFYASGIGHQNRQLREEIELSTMQTNALGFTRMIGESYRYFLGPAPAYSATKAMQNVYLQALEQQARQRGLRIRFTDIRPGFVDTALLAGDFRYPMMLRPESVARDIVNAINSHAHIRVIDWRYRILTAFWRRIPRFIWRRLRL